MTAGCYELVVRGELGDRFALVFEGMTLERVAGRTVLRGEVRDQAHLHGLIERIGEARPPELPISESPRRQGVIFGLLGVLWLDRWDRKHAFLLLYAGFFAATIACGLAPGPSWLLLARTVAGASAGTSAP